MRIVRAPCLRPSSIARDVRSAQRRRRRGARRYPPYVERDRDRSPRRIESFANPAAVSEDLAGKSAPLAHPRAADRGAIPDDSRERAHRQHRRGLRVLRRVSLRPRVQTRRGRLACRMAADGTRRERHDANANPPYGRPAQPCSVSLIALIARPDSDELTLWTPRTAGCPADRASPCRPGPG